MDLISNSAPQSFALIQSDVVTLCAVVPHTYPGTACWKQQFSLSWNYSEFLENEVISCITYLFRNYKITTFEMFKCVTLRKGLNTLWLTNPTHAYNSRYIYYITRWFKYDRDWFVCKQAALRSNCATLREWSHNFHPPSYSG